MAPTGVLTKARRAVWDAIDHWAELEGVFRRTWRFEESGPNPLGLTPTMGDLPALALFPAESPPSEWLLNQVQVFPYTLEARLWTGRWSLPAGEWLWEEIVRAIYQAAPPGASTYLFAGTGHHDVLLGPVQVRAVSLEEGGPLCCLWQWRIGLKIRWNPAVG